MATVLVDELVRAGVRHVVLCPGSRSAPLAYAARAAERAGRLTLHVRVDERSAGFLALGLAKLTRVPAVVITTSGTAVANLHPAVLEAHHGVVPLVVLSADRPVELRGTGANQTTVQPGMYAAAVRWSVDAAAPQRQVGEVARWRALAAAAVRHATGATDASEPGPVHLNLQLREPLVPTDGAPWPEALDATSASEATSASRPQRTSPRRTSPRRTSPRRVSRRRPSMGRSTSSGRWCWWVTCPSRASSSSPSAGRPAVGGPCSPNPSAPIPAPGCCRTARWSCRTRAGWMSTLQSASSRSGG